MGHPQMSRAEVAELRQAAEARRVRLRKPKRIRRVRGARLPPGVVYVGRPTRWGNPYRVGAVGLTWSGEIFGPSAGRYGLGGRPSWQSQAPIAGGLTAAQAVELYRWDIGLALDDNPTDEPEDQEYALALRAAVYGLAGADLACWCPLDQPCHADVLLELANGGGS